MEFVLGDFVAVEPPVEAFAPGINDKVQTQGLSQFPEQGCASVRGRKLQLIKHLEYRCVSWSEVELDNQVSSGPGVRFCVGGGSFSESASGDRGHGIGDYELEVRELPLPLGFQFRCKYPLRSAAAQKWIPREQPIDNFIGPGRVGINQWDRAPLLQLRNGWSFP